MRLVLIEWVDSHVAIGGWKLLEGFSPQAPVCRSVGWLARDDEHSKVVVPHVIDEQGDVPLQGCGDMTIPTAAVVRMIDLRTPDPPVTGSGDGRQY
jgi:hypothetical protein